MKLWNGLLLVVSGALLIGSVKSLLGYWQYDELPADIPKLMLQQVNAGQVKVSIQEAIDNGQPEDARMYLQLAQTFGYNIDPAPYEQQLQALESPLNKAVRGAKDFANGFVDGKGESGAGVAGAVTSDFTVVGDVRDLWEQYQLYAKGQPVNELIVTLAGVGVGLTAATMASSGIAAPVKGGVSTTKVAARLGHITPDFQKVLLKQGTNVFDYKAFMNIAQAEKSMDGIRKAAVRAYNPNALRALGQTAEQVNNMRKASSTADTVRLLRYVDNGDDLVRMEKLTVRYGAQTKGIMKFLGKSAIGTMRVLHKSMELLVSAIASALSMLSSLVSLRGLFSRA